MMVQKFPGVLFLIFVSLMYGNADAADDEKWDYVSTGYGTRTWPQRFPQSCNGSRQSPINIERAYYDSNLGNINFTNYGDTPSNVSYTAKNNGHSFSVSFSGYTDANHPKINDGGLPGYFKLVGFHFHWGNNSNQGSEHHVYGKAYPAELHLVHLNMHYLNVSNAVNHGDGLAVLGVFIKQGKHNPNFQFLNLSQHNVTYPDMTSTFNVSSLMGLLPTNKTFYRYNGSLTTPKCQEAVIWTVFSDHIELSEAQLGELRGLKYVDTMNQTAALLDTFRPPQALNGRRVLANFHQPSKTTTSTITVASTTPTMTTTDGAYRVSENYFMFLASFCLALLLFFEI